MAKKKKSSSQLDREIKDTLAHCPDCARPFNPTTRRHTRDPFVNQFLVPGCCASDYGAANPAWTATRRSHARKTSTFSPHPRASTRTTEREKRDELRASFPMGSVVKVASGSPPFVNKIGAVIGYDLGYDEDEPLVKVRYSTIAKVGSQRVRTGKYHADELLHVPRAEGSVHHAQKSIGWSVVVEDGYVKVKRGGETIAAGIDTGGKRLTGIEFTRPEYQRSNPTRQKAMQVLQQKGYR